MARKTATTVAAEDHAPDALDGAMQEDGTPGGILSPPEEPTDKAIDNIVEQGAHELAQAAENVSAALAELGIGRRTARNTAEEAPARIPLTIQQRMQRAKQRREDGKKLLNTRVKGVASVEKTIRINNGQIAPIFERVYPFVDLAVRQINRNGAFAVGTKAAEKLLSQLDEMVNNLLKERAEELAQTEHLVQSYATRTPEMLVPTYQPALEMTVRVNSRTALHALEAIETADKVLIALETLHWNGEATKSQVDTQFSRTKGALLNIAAYVMRTLHNLHKAYERKRTGDDELPQGSDRPTAEQGAPQDELAAA